MSFLTQPGPTFWHQKGPSMEFFKQNFNFQSLITTEAILLPSLWLKDWLTKVKTSKIVTFCYFWPKKGTNFILISFKYSVSSNFSLQFSLGYFYKHNFELVNEYLMQNIKKPIEIPVFICFFHNIPNLAPQTTNTLLFLFDFQWNMLGVSININNFCCNPIVLKKSW